MFKRKPIYLFKKKPIYLRVISILLIFSVMIFSIYLFGKLANHVDGNKRPPTAVNGVLDLRGWDFNKDGIISLNGQWEFYWNELLTPQDFTSSSKPLKTGFINIPGNFDGYNINGSILPGHGFATYRLKVLTDKAQDIYGIKTEFIQTAHKLWANDKVISSNGIVGKSRSEMTAQLLPQIGFFTNSNGEFYLTLQNSNYYDRVGQIDSIIIGTEKQISSLKAEKLAFDFFILGSTLIGGIYYLGIYFKRKKDKSQLLFATVCLLIAFRTILVGERFFVTLFPNVNYLFYDKLMHLTFYLYIPLLVLFMNSFYTNLLSKKILRLSNYSAYSYALLIIFSDPKLYNYIIIPFEIISNILLIYILYKLVSQFLVNGGNWFIAIIGIFAMFVTRLNDILYEFSIIQTGSYAPLGLFIFILVQSYVLGERFAIAFSGAESISEKLKSIDKLKDEFLANTSHELKTPLNGIIGLSEGLISGTSGSLNESQVYNLQLIMSSAKRLSNLVNDILDFSKLKYDDIRLHFGSVDLKSTTQIVMRICSFSTHNKNVTLKNDIPADTPLIYADENKVQQIMFNLIGNAVKYTKEGEITVSVEKLPCSLKVIVSDTGIGIPDNKLEDIFKPYEQVCAEIRGRSDGTGLGLHITKKLIELHGGKLSVESKLNIGSKFIFTMPLYNDECREKSSDCRDTQNLALSNGEQKSAKFTNNLETPKHKILVVDDEPINIKILENFLMLGKYTVVTASNGKEALALIDSSIDLVILDLMLPDFLGYEICSIIREEYSLFELPIIIMTADNRPENLAICFECGSNDYLAKPFDKVELLSRVKTLLTLKKSVESAFLLQKEVDITNKKVENLNKDFETNRKRMDELLEYDKLKTEFFANISHELRTPLNVIWSTIQLLRAIDASLSIGNEKILNYLNVMNQNTLRLLRLINNIIDTTKIDGGFLTLNCSTGNIIYFIEEISLSVADYIKAKGINLIFDTEIEEVIVPFDKDKIETIILNLLSNAVKFTEKGGTIWINIFMLEDKLKIVIKDTGIGIPEDKLEVIFERFVQVDKSLSRNKEGSGIGLSLVKSLVEMHGGTVFAKSILGKGSEFIIELPVAKFDNELSENISDIETFDSSSIEKISIEFSDIYLE